MDRKTSQGKESTLGQCGCQQMKTLRDKFDDHLTFDKILSAHVRASKSKGLRSEVLAFNINKIGNLISIIDTIGAGLYRIVVVRVERARVAIVGIATTVEPRIAGIHEVRVRPAPGLIVTRDRLDSQ